jgi:hypothetical protein
MRFGRGWFRRFCGLRSRLILIQDAANGRQDIIH